MTLLISMPLTNTRAHLSRPLLLPGLLFILTACGGGGGGGSDSPPAPPANNAPTASFTANVDAASNSLHVNVDAGGSTDSDGTINNYQWDFGDGNSDSGAIASHTYSAAGSYTITLTITDDDGATASSTDTVELSALTAAFSLSKPEGSAPGTIQFDASDSVVAGTANNTPSIVSYEWDFGDGNFASGLTITHSYDIANLQPYAAILTVTDSSGASDSTTKATTFSIAGTITAASNTVVDIDINDSSRQDKALLGANFQTNNTLDVAQPLPNPVLLNGFVTQSPTGTPTQGRSNFATDTDIDDFYIADLAAGQFVSLRVADFDPLDPTEHDIDLYLVDSETELIVAASETVTEFESLVVPLDGRYYIWVRAFTSTANAGKYVLSIGRNSLIAGRAAYGQAVSDLIPGEAIIKFKPGANTINSFASSAGVGQFAWQSHQDESRAALVKLQHKAGGVSALSSTTANDIFSVQETLQQIKNFRLRSDVEYAEPNFWVRTLLEPNDRFYSLQWHYPQINLPQAWEITTGTPSTGNITVAVVDTGVVLTHQDLGLQLVGGYDFIRDPEISKDGDGIDSNPNDPGDGEDNLPSSWHGTHVAGTVAAASNNTTGVSGVSWGARIMPIRVLGKGGQGSSYDVLQGVRYAAGLNNDSNTIPNQAADIINLSLGGGGFSQAAQNVYTQVVDRGIIVVAAAGNESTSTPSYPASYDGVISVSAVDPVNNLAPYSNTGDFIDVAAPGGDASIDRNGDGYNDGVLSTFFDEDTGRDTYGFLQGTSMATPHVAGVAALMKAVHSGLTAEEFSSSLQLGELTNDLGDSGRDNQFGYGLIDALKSVQRAQALAGGTVTGSMLADPNRLDFGSSFDSRELELVAVGNNPPSVIAVTESLSWLTVDNSGANTDGSGNYLVNVDRTDLQDAIYNGEIIFSLDNGNEITVNVSMLVQNTQSFNADVGYLFVLLLDADSNDFIDQFDIDVDDGEYNFNFEHIPLGDYVVLAGSDVDNDFFICDIGESCGNYPTNEQLQRFTVNKDTTGINFVASMVSDVISSSLSVQAVSKIGQPVEEDEEQEKATQRQR